MSARVSIGQCLSHHALFLFLSLSPSPLRPLVNRIESLHGGAQNMSKSDRFRHEGNPAVKPGARGSCSASKARVLFVDGGLY